MSSALLNLFLQKESHHLHFLFSYGSNSSFQVKERVNSEESIPHYPAYIKNYVRIFGGKSKNWNGSVASIFPCENSNVYGIVLKLTNSQLAKLDTYESGYTREKINIVCQSIMGKERVIEGFVYIKNDITFNYLPSQSYMESIRSMLDQRQMNHTEKIKIRCVKDGIIKDIGIWDPEYGIKLLNI